MFLKNILVFVKSLFSAQTIEPEIIGFSGVTLETVGNFFTLAGTIICEIIYALVKWLLAIVDFLQYFIQKLIGLDYWLRPGSKTIEGATDNDLLFKFLYNDTVQNVFRAMVGVFIILTIVFVIFAIVKTEWKYATGDGKGGNSKMQIFRSSFKSFILVLVFPLVLTLGIISSNAILASLVGALNLNMAQTFGGTLFSIAAESANKYRIYSSNDDKAPVSQQVTFYVDNSTGKTILFSNGSQYPADKYCDYIADYGDYLEYIYGKTGTGADRCSKYTVDSVFDILIPRKEKNFSGYCVGLQVDGETKYFLVKCDYANKDDYYYYLRNLLNGKVLSKNQVINSSQGMTGSTVDSLRSDLKDYMEDTGKQSFMSGVNLHDFGSGEVVDAAYNTWGYASVYTQKHTFEAAQSFGMVYQDTLSKLGLSSVSSAKVSFNSNAVSPYFDNGQFGYVSKQAEYKVMADIVDFICNNNADLYMIDVTSSMVKWDHGDYVPESRFVGGVGDNHRINHSAGATTPGNTNSALADDVVPFVVSYSDLCNDADMGNQLYIAHANKTSEVDGAVYVMCWKIIEGGKTRYVPLVNGKGYYDEATGVEFPTFKSEFYSNGYRGLVVAKGLLNNETTNQAYGEPTYIASGVKNLNGVEGLEAPYYYELAVNSELYQYAKGITATPSENVSSDGRYEITDIIASGISASLSPDTYDDGSKYYELISRGDNPTALATDPTIIANMTIYLKNRNDNTVRTAKYAGLTMNFADTTHADALNNNGKYLFVTSDGGYFVVSATKATDFSSGYFIHAITGYNTGLATVGGRENEYFNLMYLTTDLKAYYYKDASHKGEKEIAGDIALNMFEPTNAKYDGKAVFKTIDMHYLDLDTELDFTKTMYLNVAFNTSNQSFFSYSEVDGNKFKVALPVQIDGTDRPTAAQQKQMQSTIFFDVNYYDFLTGYVNGNLKRYDITKETDPVSTGTIDPVLTETYAVNSTGFVWDASAVSYDLYDGDRYVATIYKPANVACGTISDLITVSSHMMIEYTSYYNIRTQNNYTSESAFAEHGLNLRNSFVVGFNRDSLKSRSFLFDFRISLLGKGRLKLIMSSYEVQKDVQKGFLYTSDSLAFDYFFDGEGTVSGNKIELRTFYVPTKVANPFGVGFWIMCISAALIIKILGTALWGIIKRFYEITLYYIAMPAVASTIVLDDGKRFQQSIQTPLISKVLSTYGVILGINAFFVLLAPVKSMSNVFTAADIATSGSYFLKALSNLPLFGSYELTAKLLNAYTYILFLLVAFTMINELPGLITRIMGTGKDGGDVLASGKATKDAVKKTMVDAGKTMSGQSLLEGAQGVGQTAMGMIPGSALAQAGAQTIGGLMKGKGGGGGGGQKREGEDDDGAADQSSEFNQGKPGVEPGAGGDGDTGVGGTQVDNGTTDSETEESETDATGQEREDMELDGEGNPAEQAGAEVAEQVEEQAGEIMEHTMDNGVTDLTDTPVGEAMEEAGEKMAEEAGQQVGEEGKKAGEEQAEEGKKAGEQAAEEGKKAGEQAAEEGKKAGEKAGEEGPKKGFVDEAKDISAKQQAHIKHFFGAIGGGIKTGLTATGQFFKKAGGVVASPFVKAGKGIAKGVSTAAQFVGNKAAKIGEKIGDKFIKAKEKVKDVAGKVYEKGLKPIGQKAKSIAQKVGSGVSYVAGAVKNKAMDGAAWVRNKATDIKDAVKTKALAAKDWVGDKALRAKNWVGAKAGWVKDKFVAAGGWVKGKATAVGGWVGAKYNKAKEKVVGMATTVYGKVLKPVGQKARTIAKYGLATAMTIAAPFKAAGKGIAKAAKATYGAVLKPIGKGAKKVAEKAAVGASYLGKAAKSGAGWVKKHSGTIKKVAKVAGIAGMAALTIANPAAALTVGAGFVAAKAVKKAAVSVYGNVLKPIGQGAKNIVQKAANGVSYVAHGVKTGVSNAKQFATEHQVGKKAGKFARGALAAGLIGFGLTSPAGLLGVAAGVTVARGVRRTGKDISGLAQKAYGGIMSRKNKGQGGAAVTEKIEAQGSYVTPSGSKVTVSNAGGTGAKQVLGTPAAGTTPSGNSEQRLQDSRERNDAHTKWMQAQSGKRWAQGQLNDRQKELTTLEGMKINKSEADMTEADRAHNASVDQRIASKKQEVDAAKMKLNEKMAAEDTAKQSYQTLDKQFKANYGAESNAVQGVVVTGAPSGDNLADNSKTVGASGLTTADRTARIGANTEQIALNNELIKTAETSIAEEGAAVFASSDKIGQLVQNGTLSAGQVNTQQWGAGKKVYSVADAVGEDGKSLAETHGVMSSSQVSKSIQTVAQSKADIDSFKAENTAKQAEIDTLVAEEKQVTGAQVVAKTESEGRTVQAKAMTTANTVAEKIVEKAEKAESYVAKGPSVVDKTTSGTAPTKGSFGEAIANIEKIKTGDYKPGSYELGKSYDSIEGLTDEYGMALNGKQGEYDRLRYVDARERLAKYDHSAAEAGHTSRVSRIAEIEGIEAGSRTAEQTAELTTLQNEERSYNADNERYKHDKNVVDYFEREYNGGRTVTSGGTGAAPVTDADVVKAFRKDMANPEMVGMTYHATEAGITNESSDEDIMKFLNSAKLYDREGSTTHAQHLANRLSHRADMGATVGRIPEVPSTTATAANVGAGETTAPVVKSPAVEKIEKAIETGTSFVNPGKDTVVPVGTADDVVGGKDVPEMSNAESAARDNLGVADAAHSKAKQERIAAEDKVYRKNAEKKATEHQIDKNNKKKENLIKQLDYDGTANESDSDRVQREAKNRQIEEQITAIDAENVQLEEKKKTQGATQEDKDAVLKAREKESSLKKQKTTAKKEIETVMSTERKEARKAEKETEQSKAVESARGSYDKASKDYYSARVDRIHAEDAITAKEKVQKDADKKIASNAKKREDLQEQFNNAESGGDKDRIAAQMRALDADDEAQKKRKSEAQVTDADRQAVEDARKKEDGLKAEKSKAKKTLADTRRGTDTSFVNEGKERVVPAGSSEKIKEAKKKPGKEVSAEETEARTNFDEKTKLYNEAKGERKAQEKAIAAKESVSKDADKKIASNAKKRDKLQEQFNNAETGGDKDRIAAEMRALDADDKEQQKRKADAQVTDADRNALETAKTKESNAKTAKTKAKAELIDVMAAEIRVKQFGPETPFVPAKAETKKVAAETFKGELNAAGKTKGFVPESTESDASNSTTATEARKKAKGDSTYLTVDANVPSERTAKNRYNLDKINDTAVVADKDAALANIVRNQSDTEVGLAVSLRSIARYGGRGTQNRSLGAQVYAGINGGETQEGLLTDGMKEQLIVSTFTKPKAELYGSMSNEDRQKVLQSYQVVGGLRNGGGLHGSFGFEVRGKDGSQYANNDVTAVVLGQMMSSDKITKENINKSASELGFTKNLEAQLAKNLALGVDYTSDLSKTENITDSKVYRTATTSKKHSDVVAQGILDHITANPESDLFKTASKDLGISSPKDLENPAVKERVIDQISRMKNSDGKNSINTIPEADYSGKIANVMKDGARSGDFKVTPWDYASAETKANEVANVEAMKDGTIREDLAAAEKRLSRQAVKEDESKVLLNTFATAKVEDKTTIVNGMISSGKFVNTTAEDGKRLQGVVAGIADDDTSDKAQLVKSAGDDQLMLAMKKGIMLKDIGSDRANLNVDVLAKYLKGGDDIDTALIQNIARRGMNNGSVKSAVGVLESSLTSDQRSSMLDAAANQGTLGLTVGENRNLKRMLKDTEVDVNKLSYFEAKSVLAGATTDQIAVEVEHEAKVDKATNKLVESQGNLITNDAVKAELEKGGDNQATSTMFASNYSDKMSMLNDSEKEGIKLSAAKVEIDKFNAENVEGKVELAENASLADVAKAVKGNAGLSAKIDVAGLDAIDAENKQRLAMGMGERIKMYAADIQGDQSLYNKARSAFRTGNPGKDLDEADSMVRNNYLANEFVNSLSANDKNLVNARRGEIDLDYISKMTGMSREDAKALQKEANSSGKSIDAMMIEKGKVKTVDADKVDTEIIKKMETGEFVELHNEAKRENYNEEVHGVNKVKYNILRNSPNATPAVDVDAMDYEQKSRYEFTRNLFQQMNRTGENPNMLANTFRNTNLYDNDRVVEEMASIQIKGQEAINPKLSVEEKKKRLSNEQINAYLGSHEEYKDILTSYAAADVTRTLDDKTKEKNLSKIAKENPELSAKVNAEIKAQGKQPYQTSAEDYNKILQDLMKKDEAFKNAMYSKLTDAFDPGAKLSHAERIMFFENNKVVEKESTGNTMKSINEWLSKYIATDGKDTGNILLTTKQNLPENSAVYNNWNKYIDSKIGEIQSRQGQYADMTGDQRKAEIQKLQTKYIKPTNVDNLSDEELEAHVKQQEKNKQDAFAVGDFTEIYSKGAKVNKINSKNVRAVIAKNGFESNGEFDVLTGKRITNEVEERHKAELAAATNNETRYRAASKMRTSSDFGENFNAMAVSYLGQKTAQEVNNEATRRFLMMNKGKATKTGILDENFKYNDLTPAQQKELQTERKYALERELGNNVAHASMKVSNDRMMKEYESWMQSKGLMAEIVRYTNGTTKFTKQQSKTTETGVIPPKSAAKIRANQTEYLSASSDRQSVEEFNRSYRGTKTQYADAVRSKVSGESSKKALEELLNSKDISGKKFTDNALSVQKAEIERLLNNLTNKAENRLNTSYKYIPSTARPYIGSTFSLAVNGKERELQISKLADYRSSLDTISKSRGKVSYDSVFSNLNSSVRNQFNNSMSSKARTEFNNKSDDAKFAQLEQYLLKNYNKLSNHVKVNNFYHANTSALTNMNGVSIKRSVSSAENKDIMKALKPGEAIRYNDILHRRETEVVKYNKEEQHYNKLTEKLSTTKDVKEQKVIRQQMSDSATKLTTYQRTIQEIDKEKRVFEQKIEARRSSDDVRVSGGLGYNKSRNVLDDYAFRTRGVNGQPGKPVHKGGPLDRPMNLAILRFMERYKNQVQQIVKTEIYNQNAVLKQYTRGKVNKLTNDLSRTIADNRQLRKFFTAELQRLENSTDAKDMAIKNALSNDIDRLTTAEQALKTDLQGLGIELSSMEKKVDVVTKNTTRPITKK